MNMTDRNNVKIQCYKILWYRGTVVVVAQVSYIHCSIKIPEVVGLNKERFWFSAFDGSVVSSLW